MVSFEALLESLQTGSGFWHPLLWGIAIVIAFFIVYILRGLGNKTYKKQTEQTKSFLSGNPEYEKEQMHVKGSNVYWGFTEVLKGVYDLLKKMHNGNASDYVMWFVVVMGVLFILVVML